MTSASAISMTRRSASGSGRTSEVHADMDALPERLVGADEADPEEQELREVDRPDQRMVEPAQEAGGEDENDDDDEEELSDRRLGAHQQMTASASPAEPGHGPARAPAPARS